MDILGTLTSPPVLIGGVVVGLVVLFMNKSPAPAAQSGGLDTASSFMNSAGLAFVTQQAGIAAGVQQTMYANDTKRQADVLSFLGLADTNAAQVAMERDHSSAGIVQSVIGSNTAITLDLANNANRLQMAEVSANVAVVQSNNQLAGVKAAAKASTNASLFGAISSTIGSVAKALPAIIAA